MRDLIKTFLCESTYLNTIIDVRYVIDYEKDRGRFCYHYTRDFLIRFPEYQEMFAEQEVNILENIYRSEEQDCAIEDIMI